jgi:hypothetical protein
LINAWAFPTVTFVTADPAVAAVTKINARRVAQTVRTIRSIDAVLHPKKVA